MYNIIGEKLGKNFSKNALKIHKCSKKHFPHFSPEKFFIINGLWIVIMEGDSLKENTYNHIAFKISEADFDVYLRRIKKLGVDVKPERKRVAGEGRSIYFYDFDNHLFELHTGTLAERLTTYQTIINSQE